MKHTKLEFWDSNHGLITEQSVLLELQVDGYDDVVSVLEGMVTSVEEQKVSIEGSSFVDIKKDS